MLSEYNIKSRDVLPNKTLFSALHTGKQNENMYASCKELPMHTYTVQDATYKILQVDSGYFTSMIWGWKLFIFIPKFH